MIMKIGVIAGTPVDTRMGVDYIESFGHSTVSRYSSPTPEIQTQMQVLHPRELTLQVTDLCNEMINEGAEGIYLNCNSMAAAIDIEYLREHVRTPHIVTPFDVYKEAAGKYRRLCIIAANGQSLAAIEQAVYSANPDCTAFGASLLNLVAAIEKQREPAEIVRELGIHKLMEAFEKMDPDALILGCTHFPYIAGELEDVLTFPIIDPGFRMLKMLTEDR